MKEQCGTFQEITALCKDMRNETKDDQHAQRHAKAYETVGDLSQRFSTTCTTAKTQYSKLSSLLQATSGARNSPGGGLKFLPRSLSQTPKLERVTKTPPPARPSSVQTHRRALSGSHYQPVFVRPTTFSLHDREEEEQGGGVQKGLNSLTRSANSYDSEEDEIGSGRLAKAPVSSKQTKTVENRPKETKALNKVVESRPKETKTRDAKTKTTESGPKDPKTKNAKPAKKAPKKQKEPTRNESDPIPEILSLDRSPVIAGRRMFKMPSHESLGENRGSCSPNAGHPSEKRDSPELPVFGNGSPNRRIGQPKSSPAHDLTSGTRVRVLPTMKSPEHGNRLKSPPPIVKPKPSIPKKPQFLKQTSGSEKFETTTEQPLKANKKRESNGKEKEEEKSKAKKASRFSKLHGFGGGLKKDSNRKERGGREGGGEEGEREKSPPAVSGAGTRDLDMGLDMGEWEVPRDGQESPLLQGRKG